MKKTQTLLPALAVALGVAAAGSLAHVGHVAQVVNPPPVGPPAVSPLSPMAPPELVKPVLPSELQTPESVFRKLDAAKRGYLTLDDTKDLIGFERAFKAVDSGDSGKLTLQQFRKAWAIYKSGE